MSEWISVNDRLPEPDERVIVACYGSDIIVQRENETLIEAIKRVRKCVRVTVGFIGNDGWYDCEYSPMIIRPSYWLPLPEPPKGEFKNGYDKQEQSC